MSAHEKQRPLTIRVSQSAPPLAPPARKKSVLFPNGNAQAVRVVDPDSSVRLQREFDPAFFFATYPDLCASIDPADTSLFFTAYLAHVKSHACDPNRDFSERAYLNSNSDVKLALQSGSLICGFEHWIRFGRTECRASVASQTGLQGPQISKDMQHLLDAMDCRHIIDRYGTILNVSTDADEIKVFNAYLDNVREMQLDPNEQFSESYYLERNPDVKGSVKAGTHLCGFHHWVTRGRDEGRTHRPPGAWSDLIKPQTGVGKDKRNLFTNFFDADFYTRTYFRDAKQPPRDVFDYFIKKGLQAGHVPLPPDRFDEDFYVSYYVDVSDAKLSGEIPSGYYHFVLAGSGEGRQPVHDAGRLLASKLGDAAIPVGLSQIHVISDRLQPMNMTIDDKRPVTLNVFIPSLDADLMFGGYIAFLHFVCRLIENGHRIRFLVLEDYYGNRDWLLRNLSVRGRWLDAFRDAEFVNCTTKKQSIAFNSNDLCIAYSTWTTHDAWSVARHLRRHKVLFFIQEYEPVFNANDAFHFVATSAYRIPHVAIFNSGFLEDFFKSNKIGVFAEGGGGEFLTFSHALAAVSPDPVIMQTQDRPRRLICYARPEKHAGRNLFEISVLAIRTALSHGAFVGDWTFHGIGSLGRDYEVDLGAGHSMNITPRLVQSEYETLLRTFDVGLSLMWAPHPSVLPFELARAGVVTVTNEYGVRTRRRLSKFGFNLVCGEPTIEGIATALGIAAERSFNVQARLKGASLDWPTDWDDVFGPRFMANLETKFAISPARTTAPGRVARRREKCLLKSTV